MTHARVGQEIAGKYRLVRLLGEGGMGAVYEAQHMLIGRRFAIKFLHPTLAASPSILARFRREAQAAGSLESENIAAVTDFGSAEDGAPFIVMEYLTGEDLSRLLSREGPMAAPRLVDVVIQACRGLHAAHGAGIVHRDLKPENLFVARRGDGSDLVKVLDFGIAKLRTVEGAATATETGTTLGTPFYMPPEQARGEKDIDHRADVYALGVILYEGLSGAKPHPGESYNAILYHILSKPPAPLESLRPGLPTGLAEIVHRALAFEAKDRYASVAELTEALVPFAGRAVTPIQSSFAPEGPVSSGATTVETPPSVVGARSPIELAPTELASPPREPTPTPAVPMRAGRTGLFMGAGLLIALVGAAALLVSRSESRDPVPVAPVSQAPVVAVSTSMPAPQIETSPSAEPAPTLSAMALPPSVPPPIRRPLARAPVAMPSTVPPAAATKSSVKSFVGDRR